MIKFFLLLQSQVAWSILYYFCLYYVELKLQREVTFRKSEFSQLKIWKGKSVILSSRSSVRLMCNTEQKVFRFSQEGCENKPFAGVWIAGEVLLRWPFFFCGAYVCVNINPCLWSWNFSRIRLCHLQNAACVSCLQRHMVFWVETESSKDWGKKVQPSIQTALLLLSSLPFHIYLSLIESQVDGHEEKAIVTAVNLSKKCYCYELMVGGRYRLGTGQFVFIFSAWYSSVQRKTNYSRGPLHSCLSERVMADNP